MDQAREGGLSSPIRDYLEGLHARLRGLEDGEVASYIPELAKADPDWLGICVATTDGRVYEVGDTRLPFTIQSISKPFAYGLALEDRGREAVLAKIGVEPTGEAFNSIRLAPDTGRPLNPMVNAGAIAATSLLAGSSDADRMHRLLSVFSLYAGRDLSLDAPVYESEQATGHRNRAIGFMLRSSGVLTGDPEPVLDLYFRQCSISVDCRALSLMAATLANGGMNPMSGERALRDDLVESVLSVMATCGMYDFAGEWAFRVGLPAKSGVSGGVIAVLPGQLGIGVFSPRLDARGNSLRGVEVCKALSRDFDLHFLRTARSSRTALRARYSLAGVGSKRRRRECERRILDACGGSARVYELQGDLSFAAVEALVSQIVEAGDGLDFAILDLGRVTFVGDAAVSILLELARRMAARRKTLLLVNGTSHPRALRALEEGLAGEPGARVLDFPEMDLALEWCEDRIIARRSTEPHETEPIPLSNHLLCRDLGDEAIARLEERLRPSRYEAGDLIVRKGEAADRIFLLVAGEVSVILELPNGRLRRLSTLSAGMTFGELAIVNRGPRSADVRADTPVECLELTVATLEALGRERPDIQTRLLENLLRNVCETVGRLTEEITVLAS